VRENHRHSDRQAWFGRKALVCCAINPTLCEKTGPAPARIFAVVFLLEDRLDLFPTSDGG
jgi:hypothetical protein